MKNPWLFLLLNLAPSLLLGAMAEAPHKDKLGNWVYPTYIFSAKKGEWTQARNWKTNLEPQGTLPSAYIAGGSTATVSKTVAVELSSLLLGSDKVGGACLFLKKDAAIKTGRLTLPVGNGDSPADFYMEGGTLSVGDVKGHSYFLSVGIGTTTSATGRFEISGGTLNAHYGLRVGSTLPNTNKGTFAVRGSQGNISIEQAESAGAVFIAESGTLEYILDETGVSAIDARKGQLRLGAGATIRANGKAYTGGPKNIVLAQASDIVLLGKPLLETADFPSSFQAEILLEKKRVVLKISRKR